tara:strand:- start:358 stop:906 length:549 start_codon:yes stop_codon:yes gene_type:complete
MYEKAPTKPVTLDIDLNFIDNMLIVSPPKEEAINEEVQQSEQSDYLDFADLEIDALAEDFLEEEEDMSFSELDIDYLATDYFENLLDVLDELDVEDEEETLTNFASGVQIAGTKIGQDLETQITTIIQGNQVKLMRMVNQNAQVLINGDDSYTVIFIQDGVTRTAQINGSSSSVITIKQSSG